MGGAPGRRGIGFGECSRIAEGFSLCGCYGSDEPGFDGPTPGRCPRASVRDLERSACVGARCPSAASGAEIVAPEPRPAEPARRGDGGGGGPPGVVGDNSRPGWEGMMGIAQKVAREFNDSVRSRGQSYFAKNRVVITASSAGEVVARVRGTEKYKVRLRLRGIKLIASCSCPYFGPAGAPVQAPLGDRPGRRRPRPPRRRARPPSPARSPARRRGRRVKGKVRARGRRRSRPSRRGSTAPRATSRRTSTRSYPPATGSPPAATRALRSSEATGPAPGQGPELRPEPRRTPGRGQRQGQPRGQQGPNQGPGPGQNYPNAGAELRPEQPGPRPRGPGPPGPGYGPQPRGPAGQLARTAPAPIGPG